MDKRIKILCDSEYFNVKDTLECGQIFRFQPYEKGFFVYSEDKCAYAYTEGDTTTIECLSDDRDYFYNYFDLSRNYESIVRSAKEENIGILTEATDVGKGIRILNQDKTEMLFSFIISQNNNIPNIKLIIEKMCSGAGKECSFMGERYYAFPEANILAEKDDEFYKGISSGYRGKYLKSFAKSITDGYDLEKLSELPTPLLKSELVKIYGVGQKVADCVSLFGFHRSDSFPVDTWIEKVYTEDFCGTIKDRAKIANWFVDRFGNYSGYYQQYLFHYKRVIEKSKLKDKRTVK